jgi:hypothetical protein
MRKSAYQQQVNGRKLDRFRKENAASKVAGRLARRENSKSQQIPQLCRQTAQSWLACLNMEIPKWPDRLVETATSWCRCLRHGIERFRCFISPEMRLRQRKNLRHRVKDYVDGAHLARPLIITTVISLHPARVACEKWRIADRATDHSEASKESSKVAVHVRERRVVG